MKIKLKSKPIIGEDHRLNIAAKEKIISQKVAEMVFELNPIFTECWVSFFSGVVRWFTECPERYYSQRSYHYKKMEEQHGGNTQ